MLLQLGRLYRAGSLASPSLGAEAKGERQGRGKAVLRELIKELWPQAAGNEPCVLQVGSGSFNTSLPISNVRTPDTQKPNTTYLPGLN